MDTHCLAVRTSVTLLPCIHAEEITISREEISGRPASIIFDGTTHVAEAFVIVLRFVDDKCCVQQRVCGLKLLVKSLTGEADSFHSNHILCMNVMHG